MPICSNIIDTTGWPRPPCSVHCIRKYGHGVGLSLFSLGGPISSNILYVNKPTTKFGTKAKHGHANYMLIYYTTNKGATTEGDGPKFCPLN